MSVEMPWVSNTFINYIYSCIIYGTMQLIIIHDMTLWQHAYTRLQILAWGKSVWSRKSQNLRTQRSSCDAHQTHEVCQCLSSSYAHDFLMHRAHGALWILIHSEFQTWRVQTTRTQTRFTEFSEKHFSLCCFWTVPETKPERRNKFKTWPLTWSCGSTRLLKKGRYSTNIPFVHASCVLMCIVHLSDIF